MVSDFLEVVVSFVLFLLILIFFYDFIFHKSEIRTVLLEVGIDLGLLKKALLKTSKIILMCSNSLARQFSSMFHAKCLLPRLDKLLHVRSCLQNFYQCCDLIFVNLCQIELEAFLPLFIEREWWLQEKLAKQKQRPKGRGEGLLFRVGTMAL